MENVLLIAILSPLVITVVFMFVRLQAVRKAYREWQSDVFARWIVKLVRKRPRDDQRK